MALCGAKNKKGGTCKSQAMPNGRCRIHGGKSLAGMASPRFKTGRYSKHLPSRLSERYQESLSDPELLVLREEIALLDSRLADLLSRVDTGESGALWRNVTNTFKNYKKARRLNDTDAMAATLVDLEETIEKGLSDYTAWGEIGDILDQRRRLVESERKRLIEAQQVITVEKAFALMAAITDIIRRNVTDRHVLSSISTELTKLITQDSSAESIS